LERYLQKDPLIEWLSSQAKPKIYPKEWFLNPILTIITKTYYKLDLAQNLDLDFGIRVKDTLIRSDDIIVRLSSLDFKKNVFILTLVNDFEGAEALPVLFILLENDSLGWIDRDIFRPILRGSSSHFSNFL